MKKTTYLSFLMALGFFSSLFSEESRVDAFPRTKGYDQSYGIDTELPAICNASARYYGSWDFFVTGSFLYWQAKENGLIVAETTDTEEGSPHLGKVVVERLHHEYKPGMRASLGCNFNQDQWVGTINYTRFHTSQHKHVSPVISKQKMAPLWLKKDNDNDPETVYSHAKGKWSLKIDFVDFDLARPAYQGRDLTFNYFGGLKAGWITQHFVAKYTNREETLESTAQNRSTEKSWLVGARGGCNGRWLVGSGFRIFGDLAINLFLQKMTVHVKEQKVDNPSVLFFNEKTRNALVTPNLDATLGLGYGTYFGNHNWHFDVSLGYEFQVIFNQNYMREENNKLNAAGTLRGFDKHTGTSLSLHGLTASMRLDF